MGVTQLNRDQLTQLKQDYYCEKQYAKNEGVSWGELADIDELVTDQEIFNEYGGTHFVKDDFC